MDENQRNEIAEILNDYHYKLNPLIQSYEVFYKDFPITILNEIRAITSHISKCYNEEVTTEKIDEHIGKARNHLKRAILDGYKYNCLAIQDYVTKFKDEHKRVLDLIDNGNFIDSIYSQEVEAQDLFLQAKSAENDCNDVEETYDLFGKTYNKYCDLYKILKDKKVESNKLKTLIDNDYRNKLRLSIIGNIIMGAVSIASLIFGILGWLK